MAGAARSFHFTARLLLLGAAAILAVVQGACDQHEVRQAPAPSPVPTTAAEKNLETAEKAEDEEYQGKLQKIAEAAKKSVQKTHDLFVIEVAKLFVNPKPNGKGTLANISGVVQGTYNLDNGGYPDAHRGLICTNRLSMLINCSSYMKEPIVAVADAKARCNEVGAACSGYTCIETGLERCYPCSGVDQVDALGTSTDGSNFKPFFAKKSPDHLEFDEIVNKSTNWIKYFDAMQSVTEGKLRSESKAVEDEFAAQEVKIALVGAEDTTGKWRKREEDAWRQEEYGKANWYAKKMKLEIAKIDTYHNQVLNKLVSDVNLLNGLTPTLLLQGAFTIGPDEMKKHTSSDDCWAAVDGKVYDFTPWVQEGVHKFGVAEKCGTDISDLWKNFHATAALPTQERVKGTYDSTSLVVRRAKWHDYASELAMRAFQESSGDEPPPGTPGGIVLQAADDVDQDQDEEKADDADAGSSLLANVAPHTFWGGQTNPRLMRRVQK